VDLLFSGIQNVKVWLNNEIVQIGEWKTNQYKYHDYYLPVKLNKGDNRLLVKVSVSDFTSKLTHWKCNFFASTDTYAKESYLKEYRFSILKESLIADSMEAYL